MGINKMANNDIVPELSNHGEFDNFIKEGVVFVDFYGVWCMPCLMMSPVVDELAERFNGKIKFAKVNIEDNPDLAKKFGVHSIPNMVIFKDGEKVEQIIGAMPQEELEKVLDKYA
jgi:thioredoxin 1